MNSLKLAGSRVAGSRLIVEEAIAHASTVLHSLGVAIPQVG
ncbi:hypothetical protein ACQ4M4_17410 [Leptolyngbya sp. AN02str]